MQKIESRENKRLKHVKKVRDGKITSEVFIEGKRLANEALTSDLKLSEAFVSGSFFSDERNADLISQLENRAPEISLVPDKLFRSMTETKSTQGLILLAQSPPKGIERIERSLATSDSASNILVLLKEINNPSNLGAMIRTAEAAGVSGVITTKSSANAFSPKALRGSMGSSFRMPVWSDVDFNEALKWAETKRFTTVCADARSENDYRNYDWSENTLIVFGSEAHGLSESDKAEIDQNVFIPMKNDVESLNLAVSCGIILFEATRK